MKRQKRKSVLLRQLKGFNFDDISRKDGVFTITKLFYNKMERDLFCYMICVKEMLEKAGLNTFLVKAEKVITDTVSLSVSFKVWRI